MSFKQPPSAFKQPEHTKESTLTIGGLPAELSQKIWKLTINKNRVITIRCNYDDSHPLNDPCSAKNLNASYERIAALAVCSESRVIAKGYYKICFENRMRHPLYFDNTRDILNFDTDTLARLRLHWLDVWDLATIQSLGLRRIILDMKIGHNIMGRSDESRALQLLSQATKVFGTLEQIFVQPAFAIDWHAEKLFRESFMKVVKERRGCGGFFFGSHVYKVPQTFLVCLECDPDLTKASQRRE